MTRLHNRKVVLGVTGSIAAYKALEVLRRLKKQGADVWVVMSEHAREFITPLSFQTLSGNPVATGSFEPSPDPLRHINLADGADLIAVIPATANIIGKAAAGVADDLLSTLILATPKPVLFAPAMHDRMWRNPAVRENVRLLKSRGIHFIEPDRGALASSPLASSAVGQGRLASVETIVETVAALLVKNQPWLLGGVVVTAGRTEEPIDPIRVVTNRSSGRMGIELARAFSDRGAPVTLILGKTAVEPPPGIDCVPVSSSAEMLRAVHGALARAAIVVMAAAVSDYRPKSVSKSKVKAAGLKPVFERTDDILARVGGEKGDRIVVGFSLETDDPIVRAKQKLKNKNLDLIVANPLASLESDTSQATLVFKKGRVKPLPRMPKAALARRIVAEIEALAAIRPVAVNRSG